VITSVLHVATGSLTFAAGLALAILSAITFKADGHSPVSDPKVTLHAWIVRKALIHL